MEKSIISTPKAPDAIGPYSQGWIAGSMVYTSGQVPVDPASGEIPSGITAQAERSCQNVAAVLEAGGATLQDVIKTTCFLADMEEFCCLQRGLRAVFYLQARSQLCGGARAA